MLTDRKCKSAQASGKAYKLFDNGGLHLFVTPSGYKSWRLKYRFGGKEKQLTFGPYPTIGLRQAREMREVAKRELLAGQDPGNSARRIRELRTAPIDPKLTFKAAALRWHTLHAHGWKSKHAANVWKSLDREAFETLGHLALKDIRPSHIRPIIERMQERGAVDQAHRVLKRVASIFELAIVNEETEFNPAVSLDAILRPIPKKKFRAFLEIGVARAALKEFEEERHSPMVKLASRLLALTAARPGTVRYARPEEFYDLSGDEPRWIIPAAKMKLERAESEQAAYDFTIPLSAQAVETVKAALEYAGGREWLFPSSAYAKKPISENALNLAYRRSPAFSGLHVPHGWRSSFSTIMNEMAVETDCPEERPIVDLMLAHKPSGVESHYNRAAYMSRRRRIAQRWADLISEGLAPPLTLLTGPRH